MNNPDTLNGLTIHQWKSKWEATKRYAQEVEEAISRRNAENKQLRIEKWEHRDVVDGKTAKEWKGEARGWETAYSIQNRIIESLEKKQKDPVTLVQAAWDAAYPVLEGAVIPAGTTVISRNDSGDITFVPDGLDTDYRPSGFEYRTITPLPEPKPEPEPWETARYCYADGEIFRRTRGHDGVYWTRPGSEIRYYRDYFIRFSPKPIDPEGETE